MKHKNVGIQFMCRYKSESSVSKIDMKITINNKSGVKRLNTLGHLDQYMAQHGRIVKQSYCETVLVMILFNSNWALQH